MGYGIGDRAEGCCCACDEAVTMGLFCRSRIAILFFSLLVLTATALGSTRVEYLLEEKASSEVMNLLRCVYPNAEFIPHPTMNGFYMNATREDMLSVKRGLAKLDTLSPLPEPPETTTIVPKIGTRQT